MRKSAVVVLAAIILVGLVAALVATARSNRGATSAQVEPRPIATVGQLMTALTIPASDAVFKQLADTPSTDDQWIAAQNAAIALAESGNLLMIGSRVRDKGAWLQMSLAMVDAAAAARNAAESRNVDALSAASDTIVETCTACHYKYLKN